MTFDIYELGLLLAVMSVVALVCERLRLQYTIGLVLGGLALALLQLRHRAVAVKGLSLHVPPAAAGVRGRIATELAGGCGAICQ